MISKGFCNDLPFSSLDPFQFILLIVAAVFSKYTPDHSVYLRLNFEYLQYLDLTNNLASQYLGHLTPSEYFFHSNSAVHSK